LSNLAKQPMRDIPGESGRFSARRTALVRPAPPDDAGAPKRFESTHE
jgi:hypothetical protein